MSKSKIVPIGKIVFLEKDDVYTDTYQMSLGFGADHKDIKALVKKYEERFQRIGLSTFETWKVYPSTGGRKIQAYRLNEEQAVFLAMLLANSQRVVDFKELLSKEFFKMRKVLNSVIVQRQNEEWRESRKNGKVRRKEATDTIKEFVEYATEQGSKNAAKYYMAITKMENSTLFCSELLQMKFPNLRNVVNSFGLDALNFADMGVCKALKDGISEGLHYKEIYKLAKEKVETVASITGKSPMDKVLDQSSHQPQMLECDRTESLLTN